jgi:hypothetical protein
MRARIRSAHDIIGGLTLGEAQAKLPVTLRGSFKIEASTESCAAAGNNA